ncbi:hypothetical protein [Xanthomonas euvesicatoria]|uniref:hypothetical protein n=1 Tax=Xanthomonas euvesicatoria TaxID=456327 RepID=UPI0013639CBA|nr:hypothetical protein [Xanthomonas euvesicatoria]
MININRRPLVLAGIELRGVDIRTFPYLMRVIQQGGDRCGSSWLMITGITKMPRTIWVTG